MAALAYMVPPIRGSGHTHMPWIHVVMSCIETCHGSKCNSYQRKGGRVKGGRGAKEWTDHEVVKGSEHFASP